MKPKKQTIKYAHDFREIFDPYSNKWVALSPDEKSIVGSGKTARKALEQAQKNNIEVPILTKVPKDYGSYILN